MSNIQQQVAAGAHNQSKTGAVNMAAFAHIIEQYASDGAFLWLLRNDAVNSVLYNANDLAELDHRLSGHLHGLQLAGEAGWESCQQQLEFEEAGEAFIAAVCAFQSGSADKIQYVCETALANAEMRKGLISAMGWIDPAVASFWIERFLNVADSGYRYLGLAACSERRYDPQQLLTQILTDDKLLEQPEVHARALRLVGEIKRTDLVPALNQGMDVENDGVKFWANWSAVLLGNKAAVNNLKAFVMQDNALKDQALELVFNVLSVSDARQWITEISSDLSQNRTVIRTTAILGDPHAIPWLIQQMNKPIFARLAGLSFSLITGVDLQQAGLDKIVESQIQANMDEDDFEDEAEDMDADLSWPDPLKVKNFWEQQSGKLKVGERYFLGRPIESSWLAEVDRSGNQLQRTCAALKRTILEPGEALINTAASHI